MFTHSECFSATLANIFIQVSLSARVQSIILIDCVTYRQKTTLQLAVKKLLFPSKLLTPLQLWQKLYFLHFQILMLALIRKMNIKIVISLIGCYFLVTANCYVLQLIQRNYISVIHADPTEGEQILVIVDVHKTIHSDSCYIFSVFVGNMQMLHCTLSTHGISYTFLSANA